MVVGPGRGALMPAFVFPGQGTQLPGMGRELFELFPDHVRTADEVLGYSLRELCHGSRTDRLGQTRYAQPALYVVTVLSYLHFQQRCPSRPSYLLGHSLGEYCALHLAGVFDFGTGLALVARRGEVMARAAGGAMAAVIGLDPDRAAAITAAWPGGGVWVANYNAPDQIVVSGRADQVHAAEEHFLAAGATAFVPLRVSGAFHSPLMRAAEEEFEEVLAGTRVGEPRIPVISNVTARPYRAASLRATLSGQMSGSVRWTDSIRFLLDRGETRIVELGPRRMLTPLIERIAAMN
ncbi:malonyl CoA-acyl carrier protein transacylase [Actinoplanes octamycinicus]|uniref:Malonyl CoA-acyl carrier protein transacylase n=1 Tax=Actinoplanes octamycinicus TaxID=135948 RepID=A0A7W7M6Q9_9ACTN|nr:ACP S-malonyltransferase [Actinoplanes octamycinicus]MBB4739054.1 malonyl CoA-acyl carrier protein transacylase [Actinoplanes octamycinicus]GIE60185.1 polyketide biosynthesis malonyl CoA-acyl carrier protein transacylase PksC [Actinoplanes octamycinicus]